MGEGDELDFTKIISTTTDGGIPLSKYKSNVTGLTVCIAEAEGPLVAGYLCLATESFDDDGLPHTLEHLIFLGSEKYPYKGILDILANRCLASGTNAWTDTDHTCYTMETAGSEGFLKLLPLYIDHLLYPLLTDSAFVTEVHHVNPEGEDGGIVYCEMQGRENSAESRCHLAMLRTMFPGHCGYKSETGGLTKNLRESTTNEKVRAYHKQFYRPENLCIMIVGQIDAKEVFRSLQPVEERILKDGPPKPFTRPWQSPVPPLEESTILEVAYPCEEEEFGIVIASWRGPEARDYSQLIAIQVLMDYLTETSISPLQRHFVESVDPFCNQVDYTIIENSVSCIYLHFANVPVEKLKQMKKKLLGIFEKIANGTEELDMKRMETVILKKKLYILTRMESSPQNQLAVSLIGDFLYGSTLEELQQRVQQIPMIESLLEKDAEFWKALLKHYMIDGKYVFVLGKPSLKLADEMAKEETERVEQQQAKLGPEGLKKNDEILKKAMAENEIAAPDELMSSITIPSVQSIKFHSICRNTNCSGDETLNTNVDFALDKMPCRFQLDNVKSNFVQMYALLDTVDLNASQRLYLPLFVELIIESPVFRNGEFIPCHEVMKQLAEDTIAVSSNVGFGYSRFACDKYAQVYCLKIMVEEEKYLKGIQWMHEILYKTSFEVSKIKTIATKMIADVAKLRRSGIFITKTMIKNLSYNPESNHWVSTMMRQQIFLGHVIKTLESDPDKIFNQLYRIRESISKADRMTIHLAANLPNLRQKNAHLEDPWIIGFLPSDVQPSKPKYPPRQCYEMLEGFHNTTPTQVVIGVNAVESAFLLSTAPCFNSFTHPDYPALLVLVQYLTQTEGPLYKQIRGMGLSYHFGITVRPNEGLIYFLLYKSAFIVRSYKEAFKIIDSHLTQKTPWDLSLLEAACSSLVFEIIREEKTVPHVIKQSIFAYYKNVDETFTKSLLENISNVTPADMERVGIKYLQPLFDPDVSRCAVCCHPMKVNTVLNGFKQFCRNFTVLPSLESPIMSNY